MTAASAAPPALAVAGVSRVYGGEVALADVHLTVAAGTVHGLLGANGAGKSTLVRIVSGVDSQDSGTIAVAGERLPAPHSARDARAAGIAYIDQDRALVSELSIAENVALAVGYPLRRGLVSTIRMRGQARSALDAVGLHHDVETLVSELPIADQTMVAIGRALATDARLVLLDEPTANLGEAESAWLMGKLRELAARGVACVLITHALGEALGTCDAVTVLRDGRAVATRPAAELDAAALTRLMIGHDAVASGTPDGGAAPGGAFAAGGDAGPGAPGAGATPAASADHATSTSRVRIRATETPRLRLDGLRAERLGPLSLELHPGEIVALTGLADAGHLQLGDALTGVAPLHAGSVELDGERFSPAGIMAARRHGVVCVPADRQGQGLALELTARENLFLTGAELTTRLGTIAARLESARARELLRAARVKPPEPEAALSTLSGGNQQKVLIAKWLATGPRVLILCEPTVGIDVGAREDIYRQLRSACADGLAVLLASSDFEEVAAIADRALVLRYGQVVGELGSGASVDALMALGGGGPALSA